MFYVIENISRKPESVLWRVLSSDLSSIYCRMEISEEDLKDYSVAKCHERGTIKIVKYPKELTKEVVVEATPEPEEMATVEEVIEIEEVVEVLEEEPAPLMSEETLKSKSTSELRSIAAELGVKLKGRKKETLIKQILGSQNA